MEAYARSYTKTIAVATAVAAASLVGGAFLLCGTSGTFAWRVLGAVLLIPVAPATLVALGGVTVLVRESDRVQNREDRFLRLNRSRSEGSLATRGRTRPANALRVGDEVEILSLGEIGQTLDADGRLDGMPFMPEMERHCGSRARVFRRVDKIYDYGGDKSLRHLRDTFSLLGLRCDGGAHGGCEARCYMLWKSDWLRPARGRGMQEDPAATDAQVTLAAPKSDRYDCQFTSLVAASSRMSPKDPRQDIRPLLAGNLTIAAFAIAMLTRWFNWVQRKRGGTGFPYSAARDGSNRTPVVDLGLQAGDRVRVRSASDIAETLNSRGRNRGLWFDNDMLKYCGHEFTVERRVERIIDDATGKMLTMKTPCITLEGVLGSGEFLRFCAQHDALFWREIWLERADAKKGSTR